MSDISFELAEQVGAAAGETRSLRIVAGNSKPFIGRAIDAEPLDLSQHRGIVSYAPTELVLTARAGTPLADVEAALASEGQMLPFEPPYYGDSATLGGTLACNLSGPRRPWSGSIRDAVLGVRLINGRGEHMRFGGQVMKNVAGFDVSRLQAGALGAFGVVTEMSLKVLPCPARSCTLTYELSARAAIGRMAELARQPKPLNAAAWVDDRLYLRIAGAVDAVEATRRQWGGEVLESDHSHWRDLREQRLPYFASELPLWRFSIRPTAPLAPLDGPWLIDWAGAQRWLLGAFQQGRLERMAEAAGGNVSLYRRGDRHGEVHHRLNDHLRQLHVRLKRAFDPQGIFNVGRLYSWL